MAKHAVILAGGSGTRFWPLSRKEKPKQLHKIYSDKTLLEETLDRNRALADEMHISTGALLEGPIQEAVPGINLIVEPEKRDTAAAIGLCATRFDEDDILLFLPSDHYIGRQKEYEATLAKAIEKAARGGIVVIGIKPTFPSTGYGYIKPAEEERVESFTEKPNTERAKAFVEEGYLWNAGMFVATAGTILKEFERQAPDIHECLLRIKREADLPTEYAKIRKTSFDYAIMEGAQDVHYVPATFAWSDLGSFDALEDVKEPEGGNIVQGATLHSLGSQGNIVVAEKHVAIIDCQDLVVVDTEDVLLVCPKTSAEKVKALHGGIPAELK